MTTETKDNILKHLCAPFVWLLRMKGAAVGKDCVVTGVPYVRKRKGSQIKVGNSVFLHSIRRFSPLVQHPVAFITQLPDACVELHDHCALSGCTIVACSKITIGEYTIVAPGTVIYDAKGHEYDPEIGWLDRRQRTGKPITIGKRCYIGMNCTILKGVTIGDDCVIAAGTVVSRDVPSGHILRGTPPACEPLPVHLRQG
ncbi:MAG: acyltransferase [Akkermansia sp.]|nr:acyltransferase [Akkermansia sp.]